MKGILTLFLIVAGVFLLRGQGLSLEWTKQMGGSDTSSNSRGLSIVTDASGNVYTTGFFKGIVDFDPGPGIKNLHALGIEDIYISKLDSFGKLLWVRQMDVIANATVAHSKSIAISSTGNIFITGNFFDSIGNRKGFVSKLDPSGNLLWTKEIGEFTGTSIKVDDSDNTYIVGIGSMLFITRLDANGNIIWSKEIKGTSSSTTGISGRISGEATLALDGSKNIYITGSFYGTVDFDPGASVYDLVMGSGLTNPKDIFILKLNEEGVFVWAKQLGGPDDDISVSIAIDNLGNVYTVGDFKDKVDFDPGPGNYHLTATTGIANTFISKLDPAGNFVWAKQFSGGPQWCFAATLDRYGNLFTTGYFQNTLDFDPGPGVYNLTTTNNDIFIAKMDANGNLIWAKQMGGTAKILSISIAVDVALEKIYTTGYFFSGTVDFDPGPGNYSLTSGSAETIFVLKMSQCKPVVLPAILASSCSNYTLNGQTYNASGVYTQTITNATGCDTIITLNLTISLPSSITIHKSICAGETFNGHTATGFYTDSLVATTGCDSTVTLQLTVLPKPSLSLGADTLLCTGDSLLLYAGEFNTYAWQDGSNQDHITVKKPGVYAVTVSNNCASARDEIIIKESDCSIYFANAFTPNNDGLNDLFKIINPNGITEYRLSIYNRWGQKVFETFDYLKGWNGSVGGQLQQSQTFIWHCEFKTRRNTNKVSMQGTVSLLK
ncbi:MAG: SBBP repeat-containing protein [Bacteroidota bacterium]